MWAWALLAMLCSAGARAAEPPPDAVATDPAPAAAAIVPEETLSRLRAQYVPEDDKAAGLSDNEKVRRYNAILREGAWLEQAHAAAANLYEVRLLMLGACKGLAALDGADDSRRRVLEVARRLRDSDAPALARLYPDLLLTRVRIEQLGRSTEAANLEVYAFLLRHLEEDCADRALVCAVDLADAVDDAELRKGLLGQLQRDYEDLTEVRDVLGREGVRWWVRKAFAETLPRLEGGTLSLPRDLLGRIVVVQFWSAQDTAGGHLPPMARREFESIRDLGVVVVGVSLDRDRQLVLREAGARGLDWIHVFSGKGPEDPVYRKYQVETRGAMMLLAPDGRVIDVTAPRNNRAQPVYKRLAGYQAAAGRFDHYRSGAYLLPRLGLAPARPAGPGDVPQEALDAAWAVIYQPSQAKTPASRRAAAAEALRLLADAEARYPAALNRHLLRAWQLVALRQTGDTGVESDRRRADALAAELAGADAPGLRLLGGFALLSGQLAASDFPPEQAPQRIGAFRQTFAAGDLDGPARTLAIILAVEAGQDALRMDLERSWPAREPVKDAAVAAFLRDFCRIGQRP